MKTDNGKLPEYFPESWADAYGQDEYGLWQSIYLDEIEIRLRWMPPGHFMMGSDKKEPGRGGFEGPQHQVTFKAGFWLAETACSQEVWQKVMGDNPSHFTENLQNPVENVDREMVLKFIEKLNDHIPGLVLRLPSEAEWEYSCRAGTSTPFWFGDNLSTEDANYNGNDPYNKGSEGTYRERTVSVKSFKKNPWGLYQMHGNVWELCQDFWHDNYAGASDDGSVWEGGDKEDFVYRGGSWISRGLRLRSACRSKWRIAGDIDGFRLALDPVRTGQRRGEKETLGET